MSETVTPLTASTATAREGGARLDIYAPIHRALRLFMTDTLARLGALDWADDDERTQVLDQLDALLDMCFKHLLMENQFVHPAIEALEPGATRQVGDDHAGHLESIGALRGEAAALRRTPDEQAALRLYRHLALFVAENFEHMHTEETELNARLWSGYDDAAIAAIEQRIVAAADEVARATVLRWMTPALPPRERASWYQTLQRAMPPVAFAPLLEAARGVLSERAWRQLVAALPVAARTGLATAG